jgi:predicted metal-binding membrane protein
MPLSRGVVHSTSAGLLVLGALVAWTFTYAYSADMPAGPGTMGRGLVGFLGLWALMMSAMMLPALAPVTSTYLRTIGREPSRAVRSARATGLVVGYLLAWTAYGVVAYVLARLGGELATSDPGAAPWVGAGALVLAGVYQLTPLKDVCLRHCRSPMGFLLHFGSIKGRTKDVRVGLVHGGVCVGCCWGLMVVLVVMGVMNLLWMVAIAGVVLIEKMWRHGERFRIAVGIGLIGFALLVPSHPGLIPGLHATRM